MRVGIKHASSATMVRNNDTPANVSVFLALGDEVI
jgi:hypothetical protein